MQFQTRLFNYKIYILLFFLCSVSFPQTTPDIKLIEGKSLKSSIDEEGNFHIGWGGGNDAIWYGIFDSSGTIIKKNKFPDTEGCCGQANFAFKKDTVVIAWRYISQTFNSYIIGQVFSSLQDSVDRDYISFNDLYLDAERYNPAVDFLNDTTFIVSWYGHGPQTPTPQLGVYGEISTTSLSTLGGNFLINDHLENTNSRIQKILVSNDSSSFLAIWNDNRSGVNKVYGRFFDIAGNAKGDSFLISDFPDTEYMFSLSGTVDERDGNYVIIWEQESNGISQIRWRWLDKNGTPLGPSELLTPEEGIPISGDIDIDDGKSVIVWQQHYNDRTIILGRRFTSKDNPYGDIFKISQTNFSGPQSHPSVSLKDDRIYFVWQQHKDSTSDIYGRIINFYDTTLVGTNEIAEPINDFNLSQNYPNPFNPTTKIKYSIPALTTNSNFIVQLIVYDILGNEIAVLENKQQSSGNYEIEFNAGKISSGMYFYQLRFGNMVQTKKMLFIK